VQPASKLRRAHLVRLHERAKQPHERLRLVAAARLHHRTEHLLRELVVAEWHVELAQASPRLVGISALHVLVDEAGDSELNFGERSPRGSTPAAVQSLSRVPCGQQALGAAHNLEAARRRRTRARAIELTVLERLDVLDEVHGHEQLVDDGTREEQADGMESLERVVNPKVVCGTHEAGEAKLEGSVLDHRATFELRRLGVAEVPKKLRHRLTVAVPMVKCHGYSLLHEQRVCVPGGQVRLVSKFLRNAPDCLVNIEASHVLEQDVVAPLLRRLDGSLFGSRARLLPPRRARRLGRHRVRRTVAIFHHSIFAIFNVVIAHSVDSLLCGNFHLEREPSPLANQKLLQLALRPRNVQRQVVQSEHEAVQPASKLRRAHLVRLHERAKQPHERLRLVAAARLHHRTEHLLRELVVAEWHVELAQASPRLVGISALHVLVDEAGDSELNFGERSPRGSTPASHDALGGVLVSAKHARLAHDARGWRLLACGGTSVARRHLLRLLEEVGCHASVHDGACRKQAQLFYGVGRVDDELGHLLEQAENPARASLLG